jgi:hypothetical protein
MLFLLRIDFTGHKIPESWASIPLGSIMGFCDNSDEVLDFITERACSRKALSNGLG